MAFGSTGSLSSPSAKLAKSKPVVLKTKRVLSPEEKKTSLGDLVTSVLTLTDEVQRVSGVG
jgi:hypothetical protein